MRWTGYFLSFSSQPWYSHLGSAPFLNCSHPVSYCSVLISALCILWCLCCCNSIPPSFHSSCLFLFDHTLLVMYCSLCRHLSDFENWNSSKESVVGGQVGLPAGTQTKENQCLKSNFSNKDAWFSSQGLPDSLPFSAIMGTSCKK